MCSLFQAVVHLSHQPIERHSGASPHDPASRVIVPVTLSRHDLFHGHVFESLSDSSATSQPGILLHAAEYPAFCASSFPFTLGHCQRDSAVMASHALDYRNFLWIDDYLYRLDARPGSYIYETFADDTQKVFRTLHEEHLGRLIADVSYVPELVDRRPLHRVFVDKRVRGP